MTKKQSFATVFESLVMPHMAMLYKVAWRLTGRPDQAEDLVQQLMVKLYPKTGEMQKVEHLGSWLRKVLYREFVDSLRKRARRPEYFPADSSDINNLQSDVDDPEVLAERAGDRERVQRALDLLSRDDRTLIIMHLLEGYTLAELQEIFRVPKETLKTRLRRARARLKKNLSQ
ncbi:MAG: RNA polymerase sigma factor [Thermodesulfobacteriota bacterium]|nr:RNA polymerase sigma factor [Thermodesulfobacteriota bacterium]